MLCLYHFLRVQKILKFHIISHTREKVFSHAGNRFTTSWAWLMTGWYMFNILSPNLLNSQHQELHTCCIHLTFHSHCLWLLTKAHRAVHHINYNISLWTFGFFPSIIFFPIIRLAFIFSELYSLATSIHLPCWYYFWLIPRLFHQSSSLLQISLSCNRLWNLYPSVLGNFVRWAS